MDSFDYKEEVSLKQKLRDTDNNEKIVALAVAP